MNKYHARKTEYGGVLWDSIGESEYARHLDLLKAAGKIHDWQRGRPWLLLEPPNKIELVPDFVVWDTPASFRVVDFKGMLTPVFRLKARLFKARYPEVPLYVVKTDGTETRL